MKKILVRCVWFEQKLGKALRLSKTWFRLSGIFFALAIAIWIVKEISLLDTTVHFLGCAIAVLCLMFAGIRYIGERARAKIYADHVEAMFKVKRTQ